MRIIPQITEAQVEALIEAARLFIRTDVRHYRSNRISAETVVIDIDHKKIGVTIRIHDDNVEVKMTSTGIWTDMKTMSDFYTGVALLADYAKNINA